MPSQSQRQRECFWLAKKEKHGAVKRDDLWLKIKWEESTQPEGRAEVAPPTYQYCPGQFAYLTVNSNIN